MRCYLIQSARMKRYAGTNADATTTRNMIVEETGTRKKDVTIEQVDIPTAKSELLGFINGLCAESDVKAEEE
jgi:hypothetical protein